jgi:hypothetical protein
MDDLQLLLLEQQNNPVVAAVWNNTGANLPGVGSNTVFPFDNVSASTGGDANANFTLSASTAAQYVAPVTGLYFMAFNVGTTTSGTANSWFQTVVQVVSAVTGTAEVYNCGRRPMFSTNGTMRCNGARLIKFYQGDVVTILFGNNSGTTNAAATGEGEAWATFVLMRPL